MEIVEDGVVFEEDEVLVIRVVGKNSLEDLNVGVEYPLEVPSLGAV